MGKQTFIFLIIFLLSITLVSATADWASTQADNRNRGFVRDISSDWNSGESSVSTVATGADRQVLLYDLNGDDQNEIIAYVSSYLIIYDETLSVLDQKNIGTLDSDLSISDDGTTVAVTFIADDVFEAWSYDGTSLQDEFSDNSTVKSCSLWEGVTCNEEKCYAICQDSLDHTTLFTFDVASDTISESDRFGQPDTTNIISYWSFDNANADDEVGTNDGTISGATYSPTGGLDGNGVYSFDGINDYINFGSDASIDNIWSGGATYIQWIKISNQSYSSDYIAGKGTTLLGWGIQLVSNNGTHADVRFQTRFTGSFAWRVYIPVEEWTHLAIVYNSDSAANNPTIYLNGVAQPVDEVTTGSGVYATDAAQNLHIGNHPTIASREIAGLMDNIKIYSTNLSSSLIINDYNSGSILGIDQYMDLSSQHVAGLSDINIDGTQDIVFPCDYDQDGSFGFCVVDTSTGSFTSDFDGTATTTTGVVDDLEGKGAATYLSNPIIYAGEGGGGDIIAVAYSDTGTCSGVPGTQDRPHMHAYTSDGEEFWGNDGTSVCGSGIFCCFQNEPSEIIQPVFAFNGDSRYLCFGRNGDDSFTPDQNLVACVDADSGSSSFIYRIETTFTDVNVKSAAAFRNKSLYSENDYILIQDQLFSPDGDGTWTFITNFSSDLTSSDYISIGDVDLNGNIDILGSQSGKLSLVQTTYTNDPPTYITTLTHGGIFGYGNPICKGTTVTFQSYECGYHADCNYNNDQPEDRERLETTCDTFTGIQTGAFAASNPQVQCFFNVTGTYQVDITLTDEANKDNASSYDDISADRITINVIDGIPGSTCDIGSTVINVPSQQNDVVNASQYAIQDEAIDSFLGTFTGTSTKLRIIIGLVIVIAFVVGASQITTSPFFLVLIGIVSMMLVTFGLPLLPVYIFIIGIISLLVIGFLGKIIFSGSSGGV